MITYDNGRFRSHRPVDEARKLIEAEVKSLSKEERVALDALINELAVKQSQDIANAAERLEWDPDTGPPIPIRQWVNDKHYLGETARTLWPKLKDDMVEFFEGGYSECILTGCVDKQALVQCSDGSMPSLGDLIGRQTKVLTVHETNGVEHHNTTVGTDSGVKKVLELTLRNGMRVKLTPDHRVLTQRGWVRTDHLNVESDYVLRPRQITYRPSNFSLRDAEVKLLAYMATDGSSSETRARYCDGRKETSREFIESLKDLGFSATKDEPYAKGNAWEVSVSHYITGGFRDWLKGHDACGVSCYNAEVPDAVCRAPKRQVALFLNRVWAAEGTVAYKKGSPPRFQLAMTSEKFIRQVQLLLLRWGIQGRYREYSADRNGTTTVGYCLQVSGKSNLELFIKHIGVIFTKERETAELAEVIEGKIDNTNVDVVPFSYEDGANILKTNKISRRRNAGDSLGWNRLCRSHVKFSRSMFGAFCEDFSDLREVQTLTTAFPLSVAYERIKTLKEVSHPVGVADIGVPGPTRFTANGISLHNSTRWGKDYFSTTALIRVIYELYCLKRPTDTLGLGRGEIIHIVPISHTKEAAQRVVFQGITRKLFLAPFWKGRFEVTKEEIRFPGKDIIIIAGGSNETAALGLNVWAALMDEGNFYGKHKKGHQGAGGRKEDKSESIYDSLRRRIRGTYAAKGLHGRLFMISSKKSIHDFTERRLREAVNDGDTSVFVRDYATWDVRPGAFVGQKWWRAAVSQKIGRVRVLDDEDAPEEHEIWFKFPDEYHREFMNDPSGAARDIAGIALESFRPFFSNREAINDMQKASKPHPFHVYEWITSREITPLWENMVMNNVHGDPVPRCCPNAHRHCHMDLSKNRDATGFCFLAGTQILMSDITEKSIEDVSVGDTVVDSRGCVESVTDTFVRDYSGSIRKINVQGGHVLECTPEHPILLIKQRAICRPDGGRLVPVKPEDTRRPYKNYRNYNPSFVESSDVEVGDYVALPRLDFSSVPSWMVEHQSRIEPLTLDAATGTIMGFYLAEGSLFSRTSGKHRLYPQFSFGRNDADERNIDRLYEALEVVLGPDTKTCEIKRVVDGVKSGRTVRLFDRRVGTFLRALCGEYSHAKRIHPCLIWSTTPEFKQALVRAYFEGDSTASAYKAGNVVQLAAKCASPVLSLQIELLLRSMGIVCSRRCEAPAQAHWKPIWVTTISGQNQIAKILGTPTTKARDANRGFSTDRWVFHPVTSIEDRLYTGKVYNFETTGSHSYVAGRIAVHNCVGHVAGETTTSRLDPVTQERVKEDAPLIHIDLCLRIMPPHAGEIEHELVRGLIYTLRKGGLPIKSVSADRWMGLPNLQLISRHGFKTQEISTQRTLDPYLSAQSAMYERRIESPIYTFLTKELRELELNDQGTKVDHPKTGCFAGDTKVRLLDGRSLTFKELVDYYGNGKKFYTYTIRDGAISVGVAYAPRLTAKNAKVVAVKLDNDRVVRCTPDHRFMLRDGSYREAKDLKPEDSLMPLYTKRFNSGRKIPGYELYLCPKDGKWRYTSRIIARWKSLHYTGEHPHHIDSDEDVLSFSNHKIVSVESDGRADVYDISVEETSNFALDAGIFVHNSKDLADAFVAVVYYLSKNWQSIGIGSVSKGVSTVEQGIPGMAVPTSDGNFRWPDEPPLPKDGKDDWSGLPTWII